MAVERSTDTAPNAPDYDEIVSVIQLYIDGFAECDIDKFKLAFHEDAWIFFTDDDGALHKALLADCFEDWAAPPAEEYVHRVLSVIQAGDVASVLLEMHIPSDPDDSWVDLHNLLRIDGVWKDMNKTATHSSRAAWAAPEASPS